MIELDNSFESRLSSIRLGDTKVAVIWNALEQAERAGSDEMLQQVRSAVIGGLEERIQKLSDREPNTLFARMIEKYEAARNQLAEGISSDLVFDVSCGITIPATVSENTTEGRDTWMLAQLTS